MEYRILGPLEVVEDGRPLALGRLKERIVLGVLLLHANEFVSRERLIDELWGVAPPDTARKAVNVYVSKLRKTLSQNGHDPIATEDGGYRLVVDAGSVDAARVRRLVGEARKRLSSGDAETASQLLQDSLACWRGPTLAGLTLESFGRDDVAELDELRLTVLMDRIDCDLALGEHERVLGELQRLVREHPLRERFRAQQMLALYRADRQADALEAYRQARETLIDELGIEPSESLQRLQQAILRHDPALEAPTGVAGANGTASVATPAADAGAAAPRRRPRRRAFRRRYLVAAVAGILAAVAALVGVVATRGGGRPPPSSPVSYVGGNDVALIDPASGRLAHDYEGGLKPGPIALVGHRVWIGARGNAQIEWYDLRSHRGTPPFSVAPALVDMRADASGHVWVSDRKPVVTWVGHVTDAVDPYTAPQVVSQNIRVHLPGAGAEAVGGGFLWVISDLPGRIGTSVARIDVRDRKLAPTTSLGRQTTAIAYGDGYAWVGTYDPQNSTAWLSRVSPGSSDVHTDVKLETADGAGPLAVAVGDGSVWVVTSRGTLMRVDPAKAEITARIAMSNEQPEMLAVGAGSVWTANHERYSVSQVDPRRNKVVRTIPLGSYDAVPCGIATIRRTVYVAFGETTCS